MTFTDKRQSTQTEGQHWVPVPCFMCTNQCGLMACVENGRVTKVKGWTGHPRSKGGLCVKARHIPDYMYHEKRLKYPIKKANGEWQRISWDEALDTIAMKWQQAKEQYGPGSCSVFVGEPACLTMETGWFQAWRFCDVFGTPSRFESLDLCGGSSWTGQLSTLGYLTEPDMENSDCIVLWAHNPHASDPVGGVRQITAALKKGAKLIVIDPRSTPYAKKADLHIKPWPGTDGFLALALINTIISEKLYDQEFVSKWTIGFDQLAAHAANYTPEQAERICAVPADDIRKLARLYATSKSACIRHYFRPGWQIDGVYTFRSISILAGLTGNVDRPGGELIFGFSKFAASKPVRLPELMGDYKWVGQDKYPLYNKYLQVFKNGGMVNFTDLILNEPQQVRNMILCASNPMVGWPDTGRVRKALQKLDFLVSLDVVMTPSNEMADIVLPATMAFERLNFSTFHGEFIGRPIAEPYGEAKSEFSFWSELGRKMGYEKYFPWQTDEECFDYFFEPNTLKNLLEKYPDGYLNYNILPGERHYEKEGFPTPSGKVEFYSDTFKQNGYEPLPTYLGPTVSPNKTPEVFKEYPLQLSNGHTEVEWWHSMYRHVEGLQRRVPKMTCEIHPDTASAYGISDGELMVIESTLGSLEMHARVTEDIIPGMVSMPHGWKNGNLLTSDRNLDPVLGWPEYSGLLCRIRPAKSEI
jgi:formate dehydrogenase (coenzyme F420) alpha subunit